MNRREILEMSELEARHWWFSGSRKVILSQLDSLLPGCLPLLDAGCGTGLTLSLLERLLHQSPALLFGVDRSPDALAAAAGKTSAVLRSGEAEHLPFPDGSFGLVTLLDVLEHLPDDRAGLFETARVLRPGGMVLLTVPAHPALFSRHDRALGHVRRYTRAALERLVHSAGVQIRRLTPYNCLLAPPIAAARLLQRVCEGRNATLALHGLQGSADCEQSDLRMPPYPLNTLLAHIFSAEALLLRHFDLPFGISFLGLLQKGS